MDGRIDEWMAGWIDGWIDGRTDGWIPILLLFKARRNHTKHGFLFSYSNYPFVSVIFYIIFIYMHEAYNRAADEKIAITWTKSCKELLVL